MSRTSASLRPNGPGGLGPDNRRRYPRYVLSLPGRFMRADKLDYPCRLKNISVAGAAMTTSVALTAGEHIIVYLLHLGGIEGNVVRPLDDGFAMSITATQRKRDKLAAQIQRLSTEIDIPEAEERQFPRRPAYEVATLAMLDGTVLECPMLNVSPSGASIVTPIKPPLGTEVILASQRAVVVRHHEEGIAVEFLNHRFETDRGIAGRDRGDDSQR